MLGKIFDALGGSLVKKVAEIIDDLHTSGEEKRELEIARAKLELEARRHIDAARQEAEELYVQDLQNLRSQIKVELKSEDAFVRRSRPLGNYIFYAVIVFNFVLPALLASVGLEANQQIQLPSELWYVFGGNFLGYAYLRTKEKMNGK